MTRRPRIGPGDEVIVRGPDTVYRWVGLQTSGPDAYVQLRTVDGLDWSADRPPLAEADERVAPGWLLADLADGLGTHDCPACNRGGPTVSVLPDGRPCLLCAGWGSL